MTNHWNHGTFFWNELMTHDVPRAKDFYAKAIGWDFQEMPMEEGMYWLIKQDEQTVGGIFEMKGAHFDNEPDHWMNYLAVDDVDTRIKQARGADIIRPPFDIEGVGRIAILKDPGGAIIGWITPAAR